MLCQICMSVMLLQSAKFMACFGMAAVAPLPHLSAPQSLTTIHICVAILHVIVVEASQAQLLPARTWCGASAGLHSRFNAASTFPWSRSSDDLQLHQNVSIIATIWHIQSVIWVSHV